MPSVNRREFLESSLLAAGAVLIGSRSGQAAIAPGVEIKAASTITGEERIAQPDIWALEVNFKPVRMINVDVPNAKTGKATRHLIWYVAYRAIRRPVVEAVNQNNTSFDNAMFVPELMLVTDDNGKQEIYYDRVIPVAQAAINKRERHTYKNSVEIVGKMPPVTPYGAKIEKSLDGVATWRGVDPTTDRFRVFMSGFSNGYRTVKDADDKELVQRKTLVQEFWRPSDEFDQNEEEIRVVEQPKWIYR